MAKAAQVESNYTQEELVRALLERSTRISSNSTAARSRWYRWKVGY